MQLRTLRRQAAGLVLLGSGFLLGVAVDVAGRLVGRRKRERTRMSREIIDVVLAPPAKPKGKVE